MKMICFNEASTSIRKKDKGGLRNLIDFSVLFILFVSISFPLFFTKAYAKTVLIDRILAVVNQEIITLSDLLLMEKKVYGKDNPYEEVSVETKLKIREKILQDLIEEKLLINEAKRLNLQPSEEEILNYIEKLKKESNALSNETFESLLEKDGLTLKDLKREISEDISLIKIRQRLAHQNIQITDNEIVEYYETQWTGNKEGARVKLSHILLRLPETNDKSQEAAIIKKAEEIIHNWKQGESFAALTKRYSEDLSADSGGDLGWFYLSSLRPEFLQAIQNLNSGNISNPVKTERGYHILFLEDRKASGLDKDSPIWGKITETLLEKKRADFYDKWIMGLRRQATIEINKNALEW